jgi:hypothetical protein
MTEFEKAFIFMVVMIHFTMMINKIDDITNNIIKNNVIIETQLKELNKTLKSWEVKVEQHAEKHP